MARRGDLGHDCYVDVRRWGILRVGAGYLEAFVLAQTGDESSPENLVFLND